MQRQEEDDRPEATDAGEGENLRCNYFALMNIKSQAGKLVVLLLIASKISASTTRDIWHFAKRSNGSKRFSLQDGRKLGFGGMHGIPMIASSPVRHESSIGVAALEVHAYQPPWKALSDFALHTDLDRLDTNAPSFHNLVSQVMLLLSPSLSLSFSRYHEDFFFLVNSK